MNRLTKAGKGLVFLNNLAAQKIHLVINLKLDNGVEEVFQMLIASRNNNQYEGDLDLQKKTKTGDTLLHRIVHATVEHPEDMDLYMQLVDIIIAKSVPWWCKNKKLIPSDLNLHQKYKYDAMEYLLTMVTDAKGRSVWKLAFDVVSVDMIKKLLFLEGVTCCRKWKGVYFDLNQFSLDWGKTFSNCFVGIYGLYCNYQRLEPGLAHLLKSARDKEKVPDILSIKPINKLVDMYSSFTTKLYAVIVFLHVLYMSVFSYAGCELMDSTNTYTSVYIKVLLYTVGLVEPVVFTFYLICGLVKCVYTVCDSRVKMDKVKYVRNFAITFSTMLVFVVLVCLVIGRVDSDIGTTDRNILSVCLLTGWLLTFSLADGIRPIHFFFKLVLTVMATDVLKVLLVYIIFLTGFSLSIHAQFISTSNITSTYQTPVHTMFLMFNVMMGMEKAIDDNTEHLLGAAGASVLLSKIIYMGYLLCSAVVLINLLIAMMNTSYAKLREGHSADWVCEAALFGIKTSDYLPALARRFGVSVHYGSIFEDIGVTDKGLYLAVDKGELEDDEYLLESSSSSDVYLQQVADDVKLSEIRLRNQITEVRTTQKKMMEYLQGLQDQMNKIDAKLQ